MSRLGKQLEDHKEHIKVAQKPSVCFQCFKEYSDHNGVKRHFKTSHLEDRKCNFCKLAVLHEMHLRLHTEQIHRLRIWNRWLLFLWEPKPKTRGFWNSKYSLRTIHCWRTCVCIFPEATTWFKASETQLWARWRRTMWTWRYWVAWHSLEMSLHSYVSLQARNAWTPEDMAGGWAVARGKE